MSSVRFGIIGLGSWAREVHLPNLLRTPGAEVAALCSRGEANRAAAREALGASPHEYADYHDLLNDTDVDAVIVSTPNLSHETVSLDALNAGKHVLCEKPVTLSMAGCARLRDAVKSSGKVFQTGLELRYSDVARKILDILRSGEIGPPAMMSCTILRDWGQFSGWRGSVAQSGGIYHELACHYLDLFNAFAGALPLTIIATGAAPSGHEVADRLFTDLRYPDGFIANLGICIFAPAQNEIPIDVIGPEGRITADIISGRVQVWKRGAPEPEDRPPARPADYGFFGFPGSLESLHDFVRSIQEGTPPLADLNVGCEAVLTALAATEALDTGQPVSPADVRA